MFYLTNRCNQQYGTAKVSPAQAEKELALIAQLVEVLVLEAGG